MTRTTFTPAALVESWFPYAEMARAATRDAFQRYAIAKALEAAGGSEGLDNLLKRTARRAPP